MGGFLSGRTSLTTVQTADLADNAVTLAKMAHGTASQNIAYDGSGVPVDVAAAGGPSIISTTTQADGVARDIELAIPTTYDSFKIIGRDIHVEHVYALWLYLGYGGTPTYWTSGYELQGNTLYGALTGSNQDGYGSYFNLSPGLAVAGDTARDQMYFEIMCYDFNNATAPAMVHIQAYYMYDTSPDVPASSLFWGSAPGNEVITSLKFHQSSATTSLYGTWQIQGIV